MAIKVHFAYDSTDNPSNWNERFKNIFTPGIYYGGDLVAEGLTVRVLPFVIVTNEGMIVREDNTDPSTQYRLNLAPNMAQMVGIRAKYNEAQPATVEWLVVASVGVQFLPDPQSITWFGQIMTNDGSVTSFTKHTPHRMDTVGRSGFRPSVTDPSKLTPDGAANGDIAFVLSSNEFYRFDGTLWKPIGDVALRSIFEAEHDGALGFHTVINSGGTAGLSPGTIYHNIYTTGNKIVKHWATNATLSGNTNLSENLTLSVNCSYNGSQWTADDQIGSVTASSYTFGATGARFAFRGRTGGTPDSWNDGAWGQYIHVDSANSALTINGFTLNTNNPLIFSQAATTATAQIDTDATTKALYIGSKAQQSTGGIQIGCWDNLASKVSIGATNTGTSVVTIGGSGGYSQTTIQTPTNTALWLKSFVAMGYGIGAYLDSYGASANALYIGTQNSGTTRTSSITLGRSGQSLGIDSSTVIINSSSTLNVSTIDTQTVGAAMTIGGTNLGTLTIGNSVNTSSGVTIKAKTTGTNSALSVIDYTTASNHNMLSVFKYGAAASGMYFDTNGLLTVPSLTVTNLTLTSLTFANNAAINVADSGSDTYYSSTPTATFTRNSTTVTLSGSVPGGNAALAGKFIRTNMVGAMWWLVASVSGNTLTLADSYQGPTYTGSWFADTIAPGLTLNDSSGVSNKFAFGIKRAGDFGTLISGSSGVLYSRWIFTSNLYTDTLTSTGGAVINGVPNSAALIVNTAGAGAGVSILSGTSATGNCLFISGNTTGRCATITQNGTGEGVRIAGSSGSGTLLTVDANASTAHPLVKFVGNSGSGKDILNITQNGAGCGLAVYANTVDSSYAILAQGKGANGFAGHFTNTTGVALKAVSGVTGIETGASGGPALKVMDNGDYILFNGTPHIAGTNQQRALSSVNIIRAWAYVKFGVAGKFILDSYNLNSMSYPDSLTLQFNWSVTVTNPVPLVSVLCLGNQYALQPTWYSGSSNAMGYRFLNSSYVGQATDVGTNYFVIALLGVY